jgi:tRNA (cytidine/uridine-2'-O-)-methyltransferase
VPDEVHGCDDLRVRVPLAPGRRSLNLVSALAMVLGEALRQTSGFPTDAAGD